MSYRGPPKASPQFDCPCALCEKAEGEWLMFGGRKFCSACCDLWRTADVWPEDRLHGAMAPVFEKWFAEKKREAA